MNQTQQLLDIARRLTPEKLSEVIDFAGYLERKSAPTAKRTALESLFGSLKGAAPFASADVLETQRALRAEWPR